VAVVKTPGELLSDLKRTVALRGAYLVYVLVVLWLSASWSLLLRGLLMAAPLMIYSLYRWARRGFSGWKAGLQGIIVPFVLSVGVLWWSGYLGSAWLAGLSLFAVFAAWRAYKNWETIIHAKRYARMIRTQGNTEELLDMVDDMKDDGGGVDGR
jgi:hypothetical protein